jgi:hypothetical protein
MSSASGRLRECAYLTTRPCDARLRCSNHQDAIRISPKDHERLRGVGFDDKGILQITLIASWFNYINRVADALELGQADHADYALRRFFRVFASLFSKKIRNRRNLRITLV